VVFPAGALNPRGQRESVVHDQSVSTDGDGSRADVEVDGHRPRRIHRGKGIVASGSAEATNVLHQPNIADPERYLASPLFDQSASVLNLMHGSGTPRSALTPAFQIGGPRMVQIGLRVRF